MTARTGKDPLERRPRRRAASTAWVAMALISALGCATPPAAPPPKGGAYEPYRVGAPDRLLVNILPEPIISRGVTVRPDGMISLDLIGDVPAGGRTVTEIGADIQKRMARYKRGATVSVALEAAQSTSITVLGETGNRAFPLVKETRVAEAIGISGGTSWTGSTRNIRVIRTGGGETVVYRVDLDAIQGGDLSTNIVLVPGDIIYVPPTILARVGYAIQAVLFPFQPLLGLANSVGGSALVR